MKLLTVELKKEDRKPLYSQLYDYILSEIAMGNIEPYEKLPSKRQLSEHLGISINTVDTAYQMLSAEGYVIALPKSGFYTAPYRKRENGREENISDKKYQYNFSTNTLDISAIPRNKWNRALRSIHYTDPELLEFGEGFGDYSLRKAIVKFVREIKGIECSYEQVVLGAGTEYLLHMLDMVLGGDTVYGFENPCYRNAYENIRGNNNSWRCIDIGIEGIGVDKLIESDITTMYLMPEHQFPMGYTMNGKQREGVLEWAGLKEDRYILEDSYDSFYSYDDGFVKPLFTEDKNEKVIYLCSFSRMIAPSIRVSFMILPKGIALRWKERHRYYRCLVNRLEQSIICRFIEKGYLIEHIKKMTEVYKGKRDFLISRLMELSIADRFRFNGAQGGTHFLLTYNCDINTDELYKRAEEKGIKMLQIDRYYYYKSGSCPENTFVVGYGGLSELEMADGVNLLEKAWK